MNMGGRSETTSECKSVTNSTRNSISQDDKGSELKGRKQAGRPASGDKKNENAEPSKLTYTSEEDIYYEPGDSAVYCEQCSFCQTMWPMARVNYCVYIDSQRPDVAYFICAIKEFRMSKRDSLVVVVRWYYRPSEVPESVYQLLIQDRNAENGSGDHILEDVAVKERELFISDATDVYPASALRGKCKVRPFVEITDSVKGYIQKDDCFFYVLGYNPETRRLANTKGEIRVGVSHQATLPECCPYPVNGSEEAEKPREELVWNPTLDDYELMMYLRAARSMAQYAGMCNGGSPEDGYSAVSQDATTSNALYVLHQNNYDAAKALQALVKKPYPKELEKKWSDDETKKFVKGLRQYGKNFYKIRKELLSHKETGDLVEYYYTWKKTPTALSSRPHRRRRHNVLRRKALPRTSKNIVSEFVDLSSCSEDDYDSDDSERDLRLYCCRHCYTTESRSWHHGSQNKVILCDDCRIYYKKYGKLPATDETREPPPYMFKVVVERELRDEDGYVVNGKLALRSRRAIPPVQTTLRSGRNKTASPVEGATSESSGGSRRLAKINKAPSPSSGSTSSTGSSGGKDKLKKGKVKKGKKRRRDRSPENQTTDKRKKAQSQDSDEDANDNASDTSSTTGGRDSVLPDHDASSVCSNSSNNNDDAASNRSCSPTGSRSEVPGPVSLPPRFKRVITGEEGRSCVRTDVIFVHPEKPKKDQACSRETSVSKESPSKAEARVESSSEAPTRSSVSHSPYDTPATITSHYEASLRNMMAGGQYHLYPPNIPPGMSSQGINIPGFPHPGAGMDYRMLPLHMFSGMGVVPGAESRGNASKFTEGFDEWYAQYRTAHMQSAGHHLPAISYLQGQGRALEQSALDSRGPAHESLLKGGVGRIITDPVTGLQYYGPQQHSHSHLHTHFHIHPHEQQHLQNLQAANLSALDQAYLQHPGISAWRNHPSLWHNPELLHLHGSSARGIFPEELAHAAVPVHGLGSTPLDRQLQQQLMISQQNKYHPQHLLPHEEFMRCWRQHSRAQQRLESEKINDHLLSNILKKEHRNLQSPSQLENVVKKSLDSSGVYSSPSKKPPVTIDLSND